MKLVFVCGLLAFSLVGCVSDSEMQFRLDQAQRSQRRLEVQNEELQSQVLEMKSQKSNGEVICEKALQNLKLAVDAAEKTAGNAYDASKPVVIQSAKDAATWIKTEIHNHTN